MVRRNSVSPPSGWARIFRRGPFRIVSLIEDLQRKRCAHQRLPINAELLLVENSKLTATSPTAGGGGAGIWAALIWHPPRLSVGDLANSECRDIAFGTADGQTCVTIHIRGYHTDHWVVVRRTSAIAGCAMGPVEGVAQCSDMQYWQPHAAERLFGPSSSRRLGEFANGLASEFGIGPEEVSSHSIREGYATAVCKRGGPIRRTKAVATAVSGKRDVCMDWKRRLTYFEPRPNKRGEN